ncbi:transcription factor IIIA [Echria macrotheca]|uniref:Transcription factor IIIA n=1 Tax=Echria macrotheca TaxID=438768 RepID=A0AAJ0F2J2_9PEZI|nr:transcription factor IIIA [Echria macrotheca]
MSSSTYTLYPSSVTDAGAPRRDRMNEPRSLPSNDNQQHISPSTPVAAASAHLSAFSPQLRLRSSSSSPALNTYTPADSSTLSVNYQSSEFSEADDPFFGVNFGTLDEGRSPSFLDEDFLQLPDDGGLIQSLGPHGTIENVQPGPQDAAYFPLSPDKTPSLHTASPDGDRKGDRATFPGPRQNRAAAQTLTHIATQPAISLEGSQSGHHITPSNSGSGRSSEDGLAPAANMMPAQSPRLTVSMWGRDGAGVPYPLDTDQHLSTFGDLSEDGGGYDRPQPFPPAPSTIRDGEGRWLPDQATGQSGVPPEDRVPSEGPSINEIVAQRKVEERNEQVGSWVERSATPSIGIITVPQAGAPVREPPSPRPKDIDDGLPDREIDPTAETKNTMVPGQLYYTGTGGELTEEDVELMRRNRNWEAPPLPFEISRDRSQPQTSQAAIEKFERMCKDTDSIVSKAATWGTRRRSLPSLIDVEGITSGNFLKKLSISRGEPRRPSLLGGLRGLVRRPSNSMNKRPRADGDDSGSIGTDSSADRVPTGLAPPGRTMSWGKKQNVPSINTAILAVGGRAASIGTTHARSGSISATPTITSPRSPAGFGGLSVKKPTLGPLGRSRSKSDLTKPQSSSLADMWKKTGGPPVAHLANPALTLADADDEDEDEEETYEDKELRSEADKMIDEITPNLAGFQQHILKLNPTLATTKNNFLVERIAYQQIIRYKTLLNAKVKHLQSTANKNCACGPLCMDLGGSPRILDTKSDTRGFGPLSAGFDGSDGDITPLEGPGVISPESFPQDIPMPPATILPAEFECQLCFQAKKFQKPSDWTKHVHEDVQPFTCTWQSCRDPKIFKRKADWVRHENEGHRHLEWWDCDVEDCRHVCYRRDNFLQHLVREHKYPEPKVKTKAAIKRAGGLDPTWQKVEQCHKETRDMPYNEPCRFCGKTFPTWKKLTVHLAKHMEQISLPILKLVQRKELEADTIISPVENPPPRTFAPNFPVKSEALSYDSSPAVSHPPMAHPIGFSPSPQQPGRPFMYPIVPQDYNMYSTGFNGMQTMAQAPLSVQTSPNHAVGHPGFGNIDMQAYSGLPVTTAGGYMNTSPNQYISVTPDVGDFAAITSNALGLQDPNAVAMYNGMMDPNSAGAEQQHYTPQGSVSPYSHSPNQGPGPFYG